VSEQHAKDIHDLLVMLGGAFASAGGLEAFTQLSGNLAGYPFVKVVVDRHTTRIHFLNHRRYQFHSDYIAEAILGTPAAETRTNAHSI